MKQYYVWIDEADKVIGKPNLYATLDDINWLERPMGGVCVFKADRDTMYERYGLSHKLFTKWERQEEDGTA